MSEKRWGATPEEWDLFVELGLTADLLPVVSNPDAAISPDSKMKQLGKTPSAFNRDGLVIGLANWTERVTTSKLISSWKNEGDLGLCVQTRFLRALDGDIKDPILASTVRAFLQERYQFPIRFRPDSSKFLVCFYLEGVITKRVVKMSDVKGGPMVEFLATGQQFVACGTHSDGARYEWDWNGLFEPPTLTLEEFEALWAELVERFGVKVLGGGAIRKARVAGAVVESDDDVATYLMTHPSFIGVARDGKVMITCPWFGNHSTDNGDTQTTYMPPGDRDYKKGHFKCLHAGCAKYKDGDFLEALGFNDEMFAPVEAPAAQPGEPAKKDLPAFEREKNGDIKASLYNLKLALGRPDICKAHLRTDNFRDEVMYAPANKPGVWRPLRDADQVHMREWLERNKFKPIGRELMRDAILAHADKHSFDSAVEWLTMTVPDWDGVKRVETFFIHYMGVEDTEYTRASARYLWSALAGRVLEPGVKADMVPILVGPQGHRKSTAIAAISPSPKFFVEVDLADRDDNLARMQRGKLIGEIAELRGLHTRDLESIKAFVARQFENWVPKYREFATEYPRRLVFVATTNQEEFLADTTGNRRWLPLIIGKIIDTTAIIADREQLWAEARELFLAGGVDWSAERLAGDAHDKHTMTDIWQVEVERWLDTPNELGADGEETPRGRGFFTTSEVMDGALGILAKNCKRADEMRLGAVLRKLGFKKAVKWFNGATTRGWS